MKIPNRRDFQKIVFYHLSDIDFRDFINLYRKYTTKPYVFLVIDAILSSDKDIVI